MWSGDRWVLEEPEFRRSPYERLFADWPDGSLDYLSVQVVADVQPLDDRPVAVARAWRGEEQGWALVHGWQTRWYPMADPDVPGYAVGVLARYVASDLLGLADQVSA